MTTTDPKIEQFATQFDAAHLELATLAAFPIGVTVDMLYQLWYNFKDSIVGLPMIAVSNVLLSPLFRPMGNGIFEMEKETRGQFLEKIRSDTEGGQKLYILAHFTKAYTQNRLMGERYTSFRETLLMNAEATLDPMKTLQTVIQRLQTSQKENNRSEVMRLRDLIELFAVQEKGIEDVHNSTFYPILQYSIALKGAYMNAPTDQIEQKIDGIKGATINLLKEKTPNAQMVQLPASLVGKGILQKLDGQKEDKKEKQQQILALITGVNDYKNPIPKLQGAINDGEKIENWLNHNFATPNTNTVLKTSKLFNKQATRDAILKDFQHQAAQAKENDFVFFSFSGYGVEFDEIQAPEAQNMGQSANITQNISQQTTSYGLDSHAELKNRIQELVSKAKLEEAIEEFIKWASVSNKDLNNQLILIKAQLNSLKRQENLGSITSSNFSRDRSQISNSILSLLDEIKEPQNPNISEKKIKRSMLLPFDATSKDGTTKNGIWGRDLLETVKQYPQVNFVFFLDGCYCYCLFPEITDNMVALINYTEGETGMEMPFDGVHNGVFTYFAFKTLTLNPTISYIKLIETVNAEVLSNSNIQPQTAIVQCSGHNYEKILLKDKLGVDENLPKVHALLIGIDNYLQKEMQSESGVKDCELVTNFLNTKHIATWDTTSKLYNNEATRDNILTAIKDVSEKAKANDVVFILLSGFSTPNRFVTSDVENNNQGTNYYGGTHSRTDLENNNPVTTIMDRDLIDIVKKYPHVNYVFLPSLKFEKAQNNVIGLICENEIITDTERDLNVVKTPNDGRNSAFIHTILKVLEENHHITYEELINKTRLLLKSSQGKESNNKFKVSLQCVKGNEKKIFLKNEIRQEDNKPLTSRWHRRVFDSQNTDKKKLKLVRAEGDAPVADEAVNNAYDNVGLVLDYFYEQFGWNSLDNKGKEIEVNVHYLEKFSNGFWDRESVVLGDGDGINFKSFAFSLAVLANELTKGIIQFTVNFVYQNQSGALYEHFSTIFASAIIQYYKKETAQNAHWLLGEDVLMGNNKGKGICSLKAPADEKITMAVQPDHYSKLYKGKTDNGGVHLNSGIPNHAFYLVSMEIGTQHAALLWFETLKTMKSNAKFIDLYKALNENAPKLIVLDKIPKNTQEVLLNAFTTVGIAGSETVKKDKTVKQGQKRVVIK